MEKFKERFDAFSDAVIAILLTIMVLELPIEVINGTIDYAGLFQAIGIYFISFCMVGNVWYRHAMAFNQVKEIENLIVILDFLMIMFLSLIPAFTRLMVTDVTNITVMLYGADYLVVLIMQDLITQMIIRKRYSNKAAIHLAYGKILGRVPYSGIILQAIFLAVAYWRPTVALVFYIVIPVESFLFNARREQDFQDVEELDGKDLKTYLDLPENKQREFRRKMRGYRKQLRDSGMSEAEQRELWRTAMDSLQQQKPVAQDAAQGSPAGGAGVPKHADVSEKESTGAPERTDSGRGRRGRVRSRRMGRQRTPENTWDDFDPRARRRAILKELKETEERNRKA